MRPLDLQRKLVLHLDTTLFLDITRNRRKVNRTEKECLIK